MKKKAKAAKVSVLTTKILRYKLACGDELVIEEGSEGESATSGPGEYYVTGLQDGATISKKDLKAVAAGLERLLAE